MIILIPAFEPKLTLSALVGDLLAIEPALTVLIVNDGSGPEFAPVFAASRQAGRSSSAIRGTGAKARP